MFALRVDGNTELGLLGRAHADELFDVVDANRMHIVAFMPNWAGRIGSEGDALGCIEQWRQEFADETAINVGIFYGGWLRGYARLAIEAPHIGEIGGWVALPFCRSGFMTRTARRLIDYAFTEMELKKVVLRCRTTNQASQRIAERLGFTYDGIEELAQTVGSRGFPFVRYYRAVDSSLIEDTPCSFSSSSCGFVLKD